MVRVRAALALGNLGSDLAVKASIHTVLGRDFYAISSDIVFTMFDHTAGQGPITVAIGHSDYSVAEALEWFQSEDAVGGGDLIAQEQKRRKMRDVGDFPGAAESNTLNDGQPVRTKLGFVIQEGSALSLMAINRDDGTLATGTFVAVSGKIYGRWI